MRRAEARGAPAIASLTVRRSPFLKRAEACASSCLGLRRKACASKILKLSWGKKRKLKKSHVTSNSSCSGNPPSEEVESHSKFETLAFPACSSSSAIVVLSFYLKLLGVLFFRYGYLYLYSASLLLHHLPSSFLLLHHRRQCFASPQGGTFFDLFFSFFFPLFCSFFFSIRLLYFSSAIGGPTSLLFFSSSTGCSCRGPLFCFLSAFRLRLVIK